jgi:hypothetical protein
VNYDKGEIHRYKSTKGSVETPEREQESGSSASNERERDEHLEWVKLNSIGKQKRSTIYDKGAVQAACYEAAAYPRSHKQMLLVG